MLNLVLGLGILVPCLGADQEGKDSRMFGMAQKYLSYVKSYK
jgi:hypothetical protein